MRRIGVFNFTTLNGYYKGPNEDISWHQHGEEEGDVAKEGAQQENILLFGRVTYEMMAGFWPTPMAAEQFPDVAKGMNNSEKIVFSKTLKQADWKNTRIIGENMIEEVRRLKETAGKDMTILGSGTIVTQLSDAGLIDDYMIMVDPIILGEGTPMFNGMKNKLNLKLTESKRLKSGAVMNTYSRVAE